MGKQYYYAVQNGRNTGVYDSWDDCRSEVNGYSGAVYKKFESAQDAMDYSQGSNSNYSNNNYSSNSHSNYSRSNYSNYDNSNSRSNYSNYGNNSNYSNSNYGNNSNYDDDDDDYYSGPSGYSNNRYQQQKSNVVYTDGACSNNGRYNASAGYGVYWGENDSRNTSAKLPSHTPQTSQRAEATAVIRALEQSAHDDTPLEIRTDSKYVVNAANDWSNKWAQNGWTGSNGQPVQNRDLLERIVELKDQRQGGVKFTYVPGHQGYEGNEKADRLATAAARNR